MLAMALCLVIFLLYLIANQEEPGQMPGPTSGTGTGEGTVSPTATPGPTPGTPGATGSTPSTTASPETPASSLRPERPEESFQVIVPPGEGGTVPPIRLMAGTRGLEEVRLPPYDSRESMLRKPAEGEEKSLLLYSAVEGSPRMLSVRVEQLSNPSTAIQELPPLDQESWELVSSDEKSWTLRNRIDETGSTGDETGVEIIQTVTSVEGQSHLEVQLQLVNRGSVSRDLIYRINGPLGLRTESNHGAGADLLYFWGTDPDLQDARPAQIFVDECADLDGQHGAGSSDHPVLVGLSNNYFAAILMAIDDQGLPAGHLGQVHVDALLDPAILRELARTEFPGRLYQDLSPQDIQELREGAYRTASTTATSLPVSLAPGASVSHRYRLYLGPRTTEALAAYGPFNLPETNYFGWFTIVVNLFMGILHFLHSIVPSWGLNIVMLTLIVRTCLHPINRKQQLGMARFQKKMQKVQPLIKKIQAEHEGDRMKIHQEMQRVFKENDVNQFQMMGGCLMIFLQLPIWIGLIRTFEYSLDLRQASFLWISDLTGPDRTFDMGVDVWFFGNYLNILPVIYVILMLINQKLQPKPTDPQMQQTQRMMSFMMIAFGFIFYNFASGLMVYFIISALYGIVESRMIKRIISKEEAAAAAAGGGDSPSAAPRENGKSSGDGGGMYSSSRVGPRRKPTKAERQKAKGVPRG